MRRRDFIKVIAGSAVAWPLAANAVEVTKTRLIGFLGSDTQSNSAPWVDGLRTGLRELGYHEGKEILFEFRFADGKYERLPQLAAELVNRNIDILVTYGTPGGRAAKAATTTIPIVDSASGDPVAAGLVASLSRPGGNITGVAFFNPELCAKRLQILKEAFPQIRKVAVLLNPNNSISHLNLEATETAAKELGIELKQFAAREPSDLESTLIAVAESHAEAVAVLDDPMLIFNGGMIGQLALKQRLPSIGFKEIIEGGGLMAYGVNFTDMFRQSARLIDKIFKGSKPSDIPIELVTKFQFIANLKTAKAIGVTFPTSILLRADEVIE